MNIIDNDLLSIQEARILVENADRVQREMAECSQEKLDSIVEALADSLEPHLEKVSAMAVEETDFGNVEDKYAKNRYICDQGRRQMRDMRCVGVIGEDREKQLMQIGVPLGVIVALVPSTNPVATTIFKAMISIKSGNAIIFSPHPNGEKTIKYVLDILMEAGEKAGMPAGAITYLSTITKAGAKALMEHPQTAMILNTGGYTLLEDGKKTGKPLIYGGMGNGPAFVERTADIEQAAKDIVDSRSFDNGLLASSEQSLVIDRVVDGEMRKALEKHGGYFMSGEESKMLEAALLRKDGSLNPFMVGISAQKLAKKAGFKVDEKVKVLISKERYVLEDNPYSRIKLSPIVAYYIEDDWMNACEKCIELILTERQAHTLVIHSQDAKVIREFALKKPVGRILVNTPSSLGSMGVTTNLFPSMTLGSGLVGEGITSDNISPMNLIYVRTVGYGVRQSEEIYTKNMVQKVGFLSSKEEIEKSSREDLQVLYDLLKTTIDSFGKES